MVSPINVNRTNAFQHLTPGGSDWLFVVTVIMVFSALFTFTWSKVQARGARTFHYMGVVILTVSTIAYFSMASNLGQTTVRTEFRRGATRSVFWVRYIQWFINAPLILLMLTLTTGLPLSDIFLVIFMIIVTVVTGLVGALTPTSYKWGFFVFGIVTLLYVFYAILVSGLKSRLLAHKGTYGLAAGYTVFLWMLYPVCWGLSEGGNVISVDHEMVFYGILDIFAGPIFLFAYLGALRSVEYDELGLQSGKASDCVVVVANRQPEKPRAETEAATATATT